MVKKSNGKWRMYVEFTGLNKACPKDSFPLPRIYQLVNSTTGHKLLSFMDAFSGYNQILMDEDDQEKSSFVTSQGVVPLQSYTLWTKERRSHLPKIGELYVLSPD